MDEVLTKIEIPGHSPDYAGKVRDIYDLGDKLLLVASDRISAFDVIFNEGIPNKGKILTSISNFWFEKMSPLPNHLLEIHAKDFPEPFKSYASMLEGRSVLVQKAKRVDFECVVRGYLAGSGWKEYQNDKTVCGIALPDGLDLAMKLPELIFTPATKADSGHDENVSFDVMAKSVGTKLAEELRELSFEIFRKGSKYLDKRGLILGDTKFEFGLDANKKIILIDEILTPDSSRIWPMDEYKVGISPPSFDKQVLRDYLETLDWGKNYPPPTLPTEILEKIASRYKELEDKICS